MIALNTTYFTVSSLGRAVVNGSTNSVSCLIVLKSQKLPSFCIVIYRLLLDCVLIVFSRSLMVSSSTRFCFSSFVCSSVTLHSSKLMTIALAMFWHSLVLIVTIVAKRHCSLHRTPSQITIAYMFKQLDAFHKV